MAGAPRDNSRRRVLYPHTIANGRRVPVDLARFPQALAYLESHRPQLEARRYVGRRPAGAGSRSGYRNGPTSGPDQRSSSPTSANAPRFFLETSGAVVNGDCYWMVAKSGVSADLLLLIMAVANSTFALRFYDAVCSDRLYADRTI